MKQGNIHLLYVVFLYICRFMHIYIVGSGGFKVFHPMVFQRAIESLHLVPEYEKSKHMLIYIHVYVFVWYGTTPRQWHIHSLLA